MEEIKGTESIGKQISIYLNNIYYIVVLKKKYNNVKKRISVIEDKINQIELDNLKKDKMLTNFNVDNSKKIAIIESKLNPKAEKELYLVHKDVSKKNMFEKIVEKLGIFYFDGYIFYLNKSDDLKILKIKNMKLIYNLEQKKESYGLDNKFGTYKGKPFMLIKYPIPMSLYTKFDSDKFFYDSGAFYNYINIATKGNLTSLGQGKSLMEFIQKNIIWIILIGLAVVFFMTPQGKEMLTNFVAGMQQPKA